MNPVTLLSIGAAFYFLWPKISGALNLNNIAKQIQIKAGGISLKTSEVGVFSTTIYPKIIATNPTDQKAFINSISGTLFLNGAAIGDFYQSGINIEPGVNEITLPVKLTNTGLLTQIVAFLLGSKAEGLQFRATGFLNVGAVTANFSENYSIDPKVLTKEIITDTKKQDLPSYTPADKISQEVINKIDPNILVNLGIDPKNLYAA